MRVVRSGVVVPDRFVFHIAAAPGSYRPMVIRGVAEIDEDYEAPPDGLVPALDLAFAGTSRFAMRTNIRYPHFRRPSDDEHATLVERVGPVCDDEFFLLLERDSLESYVLCTRLKWARFNLPAYDAISPLASPNHEYREKHRPVDDTIRYVDRWNAVYGD